MAACLAEDDLLALARGRRVLGDDATVESHVAGCAACAALLVSLLESDSVEPAWGELVGRRLGRYRLEAQIGAGGMGAVYRAHDERLARTVAVKVLPPRLGHGRLVSEARAAAAISHRNVVTVHDADREGDLPFVVSELVEGESLRSRIERGLGREEVVDLARQLAEGLAAAHACGVIHRDLKPENLIVARDGTLKILDFGLAKLGQPAEGERTEPGRIMGTLGYLAPEQARGESADARSDLFAAGAVIHEMASGKRAFPGATAAERLSAVLRDTPPPLADEALAPIVQRLLDKDPARRFHSAADLAWTLGRPAIAPPGRITRRGFLVSAAAGAVLGAAGAAMWPRSRSSPPRFVPLTFRHGRVWGARFTPDTASLVHAAAWDEEPLSVFSLRLGGGGTRALPLPPADVLAVSASGELALALAPRVGEGFHAAGRLAVAPLEGGEPRLLGPDVQHADFAPDGTLAVVRRGDDGFALEWPPGQVVLRAGWLASPRVSPDGTRVAVLVHPSPLDDRGELHLVGRDGRSRRLAGPYSSAAGVAWAPGGGSLWVGAAVEGAGNAVRRVDLVGRQHDVVQATGRLRLLDVARDGRLAVSQDAWRMRLMVRAAGASGEVDRSLSDVSLVTAMTPDGATIAFAELGDVEKQSGVYLRATAGGAAMHLGPGVPLGLSADGARVIVSRLGTKPALLEVSRDRGETRELPALAEVHWAGFAGNDVLLAGGASGGLWRVADGVLRPLGQERLSGPAAVNGDGTRVAAISGDRLLIWSVEGGAAEVVPGGFAGERVVAWSGDALLLRDAGWPVRLRRVERSGSSTPLATIAPPALGRKSLDGFVASASGEIYAYSYGHELGRVFLVEPGRPG